MGCVEAKKWYHKADCGPYHMYICIFLSLQLYICVLFFFYLYIYVNMYGACVTMIPPEIDKVIN